MRTRKKTYMDVAIQAAKILGIDLAVVLRPHIANASVREEKLGQPLACYFANTELGLSTRTIAAELGRERSTISHHVQIFRELLLRNDPEAVGLMELMRSSLTGEDPTDVRVLARNAADIRQEVQSTLLELTDLRDELRELRLAVENLIAERMMPDGKLTLRDGKPIWSRGFLETVNNHHGAVN